MEGSRADERAQFFKCCSSGTPAEDISHECFKRNCGSNPTVRLNHLNLTPTQRGPSTPTWRTSTLAGYYYHCLWMDIYNAWLAVFQIFDLDGAQLFAGEPKRYTRKK